MLWHLRYSYRPICLPVNSKAIKPAEAHRLGRPFLMFQGRFGKSVNRTIVTIVAMIGVTTVKAKIGI